MVLCAAMVNWLGGPSAFSLYVHCPIYETCVMVLHAAMVNLGGSICLWYICALSYVSNLCGVMVLQRSMLDLP